LFFFLFKNAQGISSTLSEETDVINTSVPVPLIEFQGRIIF
jgi:hypothetical protein